MTALRQRGVACPLFMITSGGGLAALETARKFPIRLVGVRPGRRRDPGGGAGPPVRPRQGAVVRHGRHHRQDLPDRQRRAAAFAHLRGRAAVPLPQGQRPAAAHPGDRDGRDRRRRRLDRPRRFAVAASTSAPRAPAPSRVPRATAAAAPSPPSPTPTSCWAGSTPATSPAARSSSRPSKAGEAVDKAVGAPLRPEAPRRGVRRQRDRRGEHGQRRPRPCRRARQGAAGPHHDRLRRRGAHPRRAARREARHQPRHGAVAARAWARRSAS